MNSLIFSCVKYPTSWTASCKFGSAVVEISCHGGFYICCKAGDISAYCQHWQLFIFPKFTKMLLPWVYAEFARMLPTQMLSKIVVCRESLPVLPRRKRICPLRVFRAIADVANYCVVGIFHGGVIFTFFIVEWDPGEINLSIFLTRIRVRVVL